MAAFRITTPIMAKVTLRLSLRSGPWESMAATKTRTAATSSRIANNCVNWAASLKMSGCPAFTGSVLAPCVRSRSAASAVVRPLGDVPNSA